MAFQELKKADLFNVHPLVPAPPLMVNVCLSGMISAKDVNPHVPIVPEEVVRDAEACFKLGAQIFHVHAREPDGTPTYKKEVFEEMFLGIRKKCPGAVVCATTTGRKFNVFEKRSEVLELEGEAKPDMASLTLGSMNFPGRGVLNEPEMIEKLAQKMNACGIRPELEVFEPGMIHLGKVFIRRGLLKPPFYFNILLGNVGTAPAHIADLAYCISLLPPYSQWGAAGIGQFQLNVNAMGIAAGGHVRVGLEDNMFMDYEKKVPATNEALVERTVKLARRMNRTLATVKEARELMGLSAPTG